MAVTRQKISRRKKADPGRRLWLGTVLMLMVLTSAGIGLGSYLSQPGRLPLKHIEVSGAFRQLQRADIKRRVLGHLDGGFFNVDMHGLRQVVLDLPWVEEVSVRRAWPDRLAMTVTEQVPLARWGKAALINVRGQVFQPARLGDVAGLVELDGPRSAAGRLVAFYQDLLPRVAVAGLRIAAIRLDDRRDWWVQFDNGLLLSLGRTALEQRMRRLIAVYPGLDSDAGRRPARIDMRYEHGFAVQWREREAATPASVSAMQGDT